ncbi:MAG: twin-arginine translocase subunit TatC [Candidatus Zipacnadales bacterium]
MAQWPIYRAGELAGIENIEFKEFRPAGALILSFHIAFVAGIILASPLWMLEAWAFIEPALEDHERAWVVPLLPFAVLLFLTGVAFCFWISPRAFAILLKFQQDIGVAPEFILRDYLTFFLRLLLIFGVMFELPLVIMFLSAVGLVRSAWLAQHWRIAVVVIAVVCAIVTPTPDAVTLSFLAGPMVALYLLSIFLARFVERRRERQVEAAASAATDSSATEPSPDQSSHEPPTEADLLGAVPQVSSEAPTPMELDEEALREAELRAAEGLRSEPAMDDSSTMAAEEPSGTNPDTPDHNG